LITDFSRTKIEIAQQNGRWTPAKPGPLTNAPFHLFEAMLKAHEIAYANFIKM
jgi:hypothetical protein